MKDELVKVGSLEDCTEYSVCQNCPLGKDCEIEDEYDDGCEDCPCFNSGFDMGFNFALEKDAEKKCSLLKDKNN